MNDSLDRLASALSDRYRIEGEGTPTLVIGSSIYYPRAFSESLRKHLRLVFLDHRGFAPSPGPVETSAFELDTLIAELRTAGEFALRVIPDRPTAMRAAIVGIAFSSADRRARYVPIGHEGAHKGAESSGDLLAGPAAAQVARRPALDRLKPLLEDEAVRKVGHDLKFDAVVLEAHGIALRGLAFDSMMASYLLDATRSGHQIEEASLEHLGYKALTEEDVCGRGAKALSFSRIAPEDALSFAGERADLALQLSHRLAPLLVSAQLDDVFRQLEMPLVPVL
ncbi:MAG: hypothetical protein IIA27_16285, partial [Gemmatimonadetes bacterium]|nr:hypothetical protein [Gemmatimonadota bacterium]